MDEIQPGQPLTNAQRIAELMPNVTAEYADVWAAAELAWRNGIAPIDTECYDDNETIKMMVVRKIRKVERYMAFTAARGMVDGVPADPDFPHPEEVSKI